MADAMTPNEARRRLREMMTHLVYLTRSDPDSLASGRVWTVFDAFRHRIGGYTQALTELGLLSQDEVDAEWCVWEADHPDVRAFEERLRRRIADLRREKEL